MVKRPSRSLLSSLATADTYWDVRWSPAEIWDKQRTDRCWSHRCRSFRVATVAFCPRYRNRSSTRWQRHPLVWRQCKAIQSFPLDMHRYGWVRWEFSDSLSNPLLCEREKGNRSDGQTNQDRMRTVVDRINDGRRGWEYDIRDDEPWQLVTVSGSHVE